MYPSDAPSPVKQKTLLSPCSLSGPAIHSGEVCVIIFRPAPANAGIFFLCQGQKVAALAQNVVNTTRGTSLSNVSVIEHVLAAVAGLGIDNLEIELSRPEPPVLDGSSLPYVEALKAAGIFEQNAAKAFLVISSPIILSDGAASLEVRPYNGFRVSFMIDFPVIGKMKFAYEGRFEEIAPARTFGWLEEVEGLRRRGLARGASLDNALAIGPEGYVNPPRFPDEPVRHKILDLIGDLSLVGRPLQGELIAVKSGHKLNVELARRLQKLC